MRIAYCLCLFCSFLDPRERQKEERIRKIIIRATQKKIEKKERERQQNEGDKYFSFGSNYFVWVEIFWRKNIKRLKTSCYEKNTGSPL